MTVTPSSISNSRPSQWVLACVMTVTMALVAASSHWLKPTRLMADERDTLLIAPSLPSRFSGWTEVPSGGAVVNPQQLELVNRLYSEVVNRSYVNAQGQRVMLSIAYGKNQNDSMQVHKPEICYPAQGFQLIDNVPGSLATPLGTIRVRRLQTQLGPNRPEPVTYWTTIGDHVVQGGVDKKLKEMEFALDGVIADGLLFRLSSVDADSSRAYALHQQFASDLLAALNHADRMRLAGLP